MHSLKLFVVIMLAALSMQVHASHNRSKEQDELHDAVCEFQRNTVRPTVEYETSPIIVVRDNLMNTLMSIIDRDRYITHQGAKKSTARFVKNLDEHKVGLEIKMMNHDELFQIALQIKSDADNSSYQCRSNYARLEKICSKIIKKEK